MLNKDWTKFCFQVAVEFCEDAAYNGLLYVESRFCPNFLVGDSGSVCWCQAQFNLKSVSDPNKLLFSPPQQTKQTQKEGTKKLVFVQIAGSFTSDDVVEAVLRGFKQGEKEFGVVARVLLCCIRSLHPPCRVSICFLKLLSSNICFLNLLSSNICLSGNLYIQGPASVQWGHLEVVCQVQRPGGGGNRHCRWVPSFPGPDNIECLQTKFPHIMLVAGDEEGLDPKADDMFEPSTYKVLFKPPTGYPYLYIFNTLNKLLFKILPDMKIGPPRFLLKQRSWEWTGLFMLER